MKSQKGASEALQKIIHLIFDDSGLPVRYSQIQPYLNEYIRVRQLKKSELIVAAGQRIRNVYILVSGGAYLTRNTGKGSYITIARVPAPDIIGVVQVFSKDPLYYSDIFASERTLVLDINHEHFYRSVAANLDLAMICLSVMCGQHLRSRVRLEFQKIPNSTDRLVAYIYHRWMESGLSRKTMRLSDKHAVIASDAGISLRTLYRAVNRLVEEDSLTIEKGGVLVLTPSQLDSIADRFREITVPW